MASNLLVRLTRNVKPTTAADVIIALVRCGYCSYNFLLLMLMKLILMQVVMRRFQYVQPACRQCCRRRAYSEALAFLTARPSATVGSIGWIVADRRYCCLYCNQGRGSARRGWGDWPLHHVLHERHDRPRTGTGSWASVANWYLQYKVSGKLI